MQIFEKELADTDSIYCAKPTNSHQSSIFIGPTDGPAPCGLFGADYVSDMDVVIELSRDNLLLNVLYHFLCGTKYKKRGSNLDWELDKNWLLEKQLVIQKVFKGATARFHVSINKETTRTYLKGIAGVKAEGGTEKIDIRNYLFSGDVLRMCRKEDSSVAIVIAGRGGEEVLLDQETNEHPMVQRHDILSYAIECYGRERGNRKTTGWNNYDEWSKSVRSEMSTIGENRLNDPAFNYPSFMRKFAISYTVADTKFANHTTAEQTAVLKFLREQRENPRDISCYLDGTLRPQVNDVDVKGMGSQATLYFLAEMHPDKYATFSRVVCETLGWLGLGCDASQHEVTLRDYQKCMAKQSVILERMAEMGVGRASDDTQDADFLTVNQFLWFVHKESDLIMQEWSKHMKHEIKLTNQTAVAENDFAAFIKKFVDAAKDAGLTYEDNLIKRFVSALLAKPFVVLTGLSGSGKTKLAQIFTQWIATKDMYRIVPVGADWTNSEKLLGYPNALDPNNYILPDTGVLKLMIDANDNPTVPFFLILDEMNLSHVERYFADFLSAMESEGSIKLYDGKNRMADDGTPVPPTIPFPNNLFVIGTMNVDETTHAFSPKVLDRAQVIEFRVSESQINAFLDNPTKPDLAKIEGKGVEYATAFLKLHDEPIELTAADKAKMNAPLKNFFPVLAELSSEFAFRTASEALKFCGFALKSVMSEEETVDAAIMQKLLPKLHGSRRRLAAPLEAFWGFCRKDDKTQTIADVCKKDATDKVSDVAKFPVSAEKIRRLYKAAEQNGFASYAEA